MSVKEFEEKYPEVAKRYIIVQGFAQETLSEEELMTFFNDVDEQGKPVFVTRKGVYVVTPAVSLDDFTYDYHAASELSVLVDENKLKILKNFYTVVTFAFENNEKAVAISEDLNYLLGLEGA
ncbi:MAG: hypothetical protein LBM95_04485 [Lactobacillales bacterium]|jgi:hypothetical protein|nr:hypothetical protein [Lactobacillales bacterium]